MSPNAHSPEGNWLDAFIVDATTRSLCTQIHCTTCGAREFRAGLRHALQRVVTTPTLSLAAAANLEALTHALAHLTIDSEETHRYNGALRMILFEMWSAAGPHGFDAHVGDRLIGTRAGDVLAAMRAHYAKRLAARQRHEEAQDPAKIAARRAERRQMKQQRHLEHLARKAERDRVRREGRDLK